MDRKCVYRLILRITTLAAICFLAYIDMIPAEAAVFLLMAILGESSGFVANGVKNKINGN